MIRQRHLGGQRRLFAWNNRLQRNVGQLSINGLLGFVDRDGRECRAFLGGCGLGRAASVAKQILNLASVVAGVLLAEGSNLVYLLLCNRSNLLGLGPHDIGRVLKMMVDQLLVVDVDERSDESQHSSNDGQAPVWYDFGKVIRHKGKNGSLQHVSDLCYSICNSRCLEGRSTYSERGGNILYEENSLCLDDKEVEKLMDIAHGTINDLAGYCPVATRANLGGKTFVQEELSNTFGRDCNTESHPRELEGIAGDIHISSSENESDDRDQGNSRGTYSY